MPKGQGGLRANASRGYDTSAGAFHHGISSLLFCHRDFQSGKRGSTPSTLNSVITAARSPVAKGLQPSLSFTTELRAQCTPEDLTLTQGSQKKGKRRCISQKAGCNMRFVILVLKTSHRNTHKRTQQDLQIISIQQSWPFTSIFHLEKTEEHRVKYRVFFLLLKLQCQKHRLADGLCGNYRLPSIKSVSKQNIFQQLWLRKVECVCLSPSLRFGYCL